MDTTPLNITSKPTLDSVRNLLEAADLPTADLTDEHLRHFFVCGSKSEPSGAVGMEIYGSNALLRSLVVSPAKRAQGIGAALVSHIESYARAQGVQSMYLLTTTAQAFFERLGYRAADRKDAPLAIRSTQEFSSICPASSAFLVKTLVG